MQGVESAFDRAIMDAVILESLLDMSRGKAKKNSGLKEGELTIDATIATNDVALLLFPTEDHNAAFSKDNASLQDRLKLMSNHYHIVLKRVSSVFEARKAVLDVISSGREISHLELGGHGTPTSLTWNHRTFGGRLSSESVDPVVHGEFRELFSQLKKEATILTLSCRGGERVTTGENLIQCIARLAQGHEVAGTKTVNGPHLELMVMSCKPMVLEYFDPKEQRNVTDREYVPDF